MKVVANQTRVGNVIEHQKKLWRIVKINHTMPGKGGAFNQMELKDLKTGTKLNERFRATETLEVCRLEQKDYQYLYMEGDMLMLMDNETYEQTNINKKVLGELEVFLQDGMTISVESYEDDIIGAVLPEHVTLEIIDTEAVVKGQTAASSNKPATMDNGIRVMVPPFIGVGDRIIVRTSDSAYIERAKG